MFLAEMLSEFYPDLNDENLASRPYFIKILYECTKLGFSATFRTLAHNGEINTLKGNINWMKIHEQDMSSSLFKNIKDLKPVIKHIGLRSPR